MTTQTARTLTRTARSTTDYDSAGPLGPVVAAQLSSLDDTDTHASAWADALAAADADADADAAAAAADKAGADAPPSSRRHEHQASWGGRGRGGRGLSRRTYQPLDVSVENVTLEYVGDAAAGTTGSANMLLDDAHLKLLPGRVYAVIGRNGCGKSTLLRRIDAGKIPGLPSHLVTMCVPQEVFGSDALDPVEIVLAHHRKLKRRSAEAARAEIGRLEARLEELDVESEEDRGKIESLCERIGQLEEELGTVDGGDAVHTDAGDAIEYGDDVRRRAEEALRFFRVPDSAFDVPTSKLSGGLRKKIALSCALFYRPRLLLLDEPTNHQDVSGIVQLRRLVADCVRDGRTTVVLVSHDVDLIDDVATDVIHFHDRKLSYYPGNYRDFVGYRRQGLVHALRQADKLDRQRAAVVSTIDNLKKQSAGSKSTSEKKKIRKQIESRKKKLERHGLESDERGHRWTAQKAGTGIRPGSINGLDASSRAKLGHKQLLKMVEGSVAPVPDKAVQFDFRNVSCTWGEPLVMAMDVGHGFGLPDRGGGGDGDGGNDDGNDDGAGGIRDHFVGGERRRGMLFDCVDLCINEGTTTCILGPNGCGKSTLLRILAGTERPREGKVHRAHGLTLGYFSQHAADELIGRYVASPPPSSSSAGDEDVDDAVAGEGGSGGGKAHRAIVTPLSILSDLYPSKSEQDLRGELTSFGLDPRQATTNVRFLSGGERCRLCLASIMLTDPQLLLLDEVTNHLDVESVEALAYGIKKWNGTVVLVTHDANLIRSVNGTCLVLTEEDGKLKRVPGGIDSYLRAFRL